MPRREITVKKLSRADWYRSTTDKVKYAPFIIGRSETVNRWNFKVETGVLLMRQQRCVVTRKVLLTFFTPTVTLKDNREKR